MKIIINNDSFGEIGTAVFYRLNKYIPDEIPQENIEEIIQDNISDKIQYRGNKEIISYGDFSEYNFSYLVDKYKFNDKLKINYLDSDSKNIIGKNTDTLERFESIIFPTLSNSNEDLSEDYFGSGIISNYQTFILLSCSGSFNNKKGYYKIELYEDSVLNNNNQYNNFINYDLLEKLNITITNKPALSIYMGPDSSVRNNSSSMYYDFDPMKVDKDNNELMNLLEYGDLLEEITKNKMIGVTISTDMDKININLSYRSWIDSLNPNRNLNKFFIRNDEFYSKIENISIIDKKFKDEAGIFLDTNSGTLIGTLEKDDNLCPILKRKKYLSEKITKYYSPYKRYSLGDIISYSGEDWVSLINNNYNNNPITSLFWTRKTSINDFFTSRVSIIINPINSGYTSISGLITIVDKNVSKSIIVTEFSGFELDEKNPCLYDKDTPLPKKDFIISKNVTTSGIIIKTITIVNWEKPISTGYLYINLKSIKSKFKFVASYSGNTIDYNNWIDYFNEPNFKFNNFILGNKLINEEEINSSNGELFGELNDVLFFRLNKLNKYEIFNIKSEKIINNTLVIENLIPEKETSYIYKDIIDYSISTYTLEILIKKFNVIVNNTMYIEVSDLLNEVEYGESCNIQFYQINSSINIEKINISNEIEEINFTLQEIDSEKLLSDSIVILTRLEEDSNIYSISISNITSNINISFDYSNSEPNQSLKLNLGKLNINKLN